MRFKKKLDSLVWAIISFLPLFIYLIMTINNGVDISFSDYIASFSFGFIYDIITSIEVFTFNLDLVALISYMASVEIIHVFYDFIVFLPRFAHNLMGGIYDKESK